MTDPIPLETGHLAEVAGMLGRAFRDDPVFVVALPSVAAAERERRIRALYRTFAVACLRQGRANVIVEDGRVAAASLTYPPATYRRSLRGWVRNITAAARLGPAGLWRLSKVEVFMGEHHYRARHWYLHVLGVDPALHGRGLGGALMHHLSRHADRDGVPCYLETTQPKNVGYYGRFGYEVWHEGSVPGLRDLRVWCMLRTGPSV